MRVIIYSSDKTQWALRPFAHLFNLYWSPDVPVQVFVNSIPPFHLPPNFALDVIGPFLPVGEWSTDFIAALQHIKDDVICIAMDDYFLNRMVDQRAVKWCYEYMLEHTEVARFDLTTDRLGASGITDYCKIGYLDVIKSDPKSPYHFSLQAALWRRERLLGCLVPHETPWDVEIRGDERLRNSGALVLGTRQAPVHYTIAVQQGKFTPDGGYQTSVNAMQPSDVDYIVGHDWIPHELMTEAMA